MGQLGPCSVPLLLLSLIKFHCNSVNVAWLKVHILSAKKHSKDAIVVADNSSITPRKKTPYRISLSHNDGCFGKGLSTRNVTKLPRHNYVAPYWVFFSDSEAWLRGWRSQSSYMVIRKFRYWFNRKRSTKRIEVVFDHFPLRVCSATHRRHSSFQVSFMPSVVACE